jgi:hypothetical protein
MSLFHKSAFVGSIGIHQSTEFLFIHTFCHNPNIQKSSLRLLKIVTFFLTYGKSFDKNNILFLEAEPPKRRRNDLGANHLVYHYHASGERGSVPNQGGGYFSFVKSES